MRRPDPRVICVVVPAHDEEALLPGALRALEVARAGTDIEVEVVVVANGCRDQTADVARRHGVEVLETAYANVGHARSAGFAHLIQRHETHLSEVWLAGTDADSRVPANWFEAHRAAAASGADVYLGTVELHERDRAAAQAWIDAYDAQVVRDADHGHIHGANFGVRALPYAMVGGFTALALSEDVDLVARLVRCGAHLTWCSEAPVITSARPSGRAVGGVASDISRCIAEAHDVAAQEGGAA